MKEMFFSLLYCAIFSSKIDIIQELFNKGAKLTDSWNDQHMILSKAISQHSNIFKFLYQNHSPDFSTTPKKPTHTMRAVIEHNLKLFTI